MQYCWDKSWVMKQFTCGSCKGCFASVSLGIVMKDDDDDDEEESSCSYDVPCEDFMHQFNSCYMCDVRITVNALNSLLIYLSCIVCELHD